MFHFYPIIKTSLTTRLEALIAPWRRVAEVVITPALANSHFAEQSKRSG